jgi:hypothetical protein
MAMPWGLPTTAVGLTRAGRRRHRRRWPSGWAWITPRAHRDGGLRRAGPAVEPPRSKPGPSTGSWCSESGLLDGGAANVIRLPADIRPLELLPLCGRVRHQTGLQHLL